MTFYVHNTSNYEMLGFFAKPVLCFTDCLSTLDVTATVIHSNYQAPTQALAK